MGLVGAPPMSKHLHKWILTLAFQAGFSVLTGPVALAVSTPEYPSPTTFWTGRQYIDFYFVHFNTHLALPHLRNSQSRALFDRMTDRANIERILAGAATPSEKRHQLQLILATMGSIRGSYNLAVIIGEPLQEELTRVQVFHLYLVGVVADFEEDIATAPGAPAMKTAWLGVMRSLGEGDVYSPAQIATLSDAAARRYPSLRDLFTVRERTLLRGRVEALQAKQASPRSQLALSRLLATVSAE